MYSTCILVLILVIIDDNNYYSTMFSLNFSKSVLFWCSRNNDIRYFQFFYLKSVQDDTGCICTSSLHTILVVHFVLAPSCSDPYMGESDGRTCYFTSTSQSIVSIK